MAWTVGIVRALAICIFLLLAASTIADIFGDPRATAIIRAMALRPVIAAIGSIRVAQLEREFRFRSLTYIDLSTAIVNTAVAVGMAESLGVWALVAGTLAGTFTGVLTSYIVAPHRPRVEIDGARARSLMAFGRWVLAGGVVAMIGEGILVATISRVLGTDALGRYSLAVSIALAPAAMAGSLIGGVAFAVHSRVFPDEAQTRRVFRASITAMNVLVLPAYAILIVLAPEIVERLLDQQWHGTGPIIQLLAASAIVGVAFDVASPMLLGAGRPRAVALLNVIFAVVIALLAWPMALRFGLEGAAAARIVADLSIALGCVALVRTMLARPLRGMWIPSASIMFAAVSGAALAWSIAQWSTQVAVLALGGIGGLALSMTFIWLCDRWLNMGFQRDASLVIPAMRL